MKSINLSILVVPIIIMFPILINNIKQKDWVDVVINVGFSIMFFLLSKLYLYCIDIIHNSNKLVDIYSDSLKREEKLKNALNTAVDEISKICESKKS